MSPVLANVTRGGIVESRHSGTIALCDASGGVLWSLGDPDSVAFWRSSAKPVQVVPILESGAADRFGFTGAELAVMASSHGGEPEHVSAVLSILERIGLDPGYLACGVHPPYDKAAAEALAARGERPSELHSDCSGKHAGMLALAVHLGAPVEGYWRPDHPVQRVILGQIARYAGVPEDRIPTGTDGCGVPVFALPIRAMATAYARLPVGSGARVVDAMMECPQMVAGTGRFCTELMKALPGTVAAKGGAEGVFCLSLPDRGLGIACKIDDGSSRAVGPIILRTLLANGFLPQGIPDALLRFCPIPVDNFRGEVVGAIAPAF